MFGFDEIFKKKNKTIEEQCFEYISDADPVPEPHELTMYHVPEEETFKYEERVPDNIEMVDAKGRTLKRNGKPITIEDTLKSRWKIIIRKMMKEATCERDKWLLLVGIISGKTSEELSKLSYMESSIIIWKFSKKMDKQFSSWCVRRGLDPDDPAFTSKTTGQTLERTTIYRIINGILKRFYKKNSKRTVVKGGIRYLKAFGNLIRERFNKALAKAIDFTKEDIVKSLKEMSWRIKVVLDEGILPDIEKFKSKDEWEHYLEIKEIEEAMKMVFQS